MHDRDVSGVPDIVAGRTPASRIAIASAADAELDLALKRRIANEALLFLGFQVLLADAVFMVYGSWNEWRVPSEAIVSWLAACVAEVIGVVLVITRSLFPKRRKR